MKQQIQHQLLMNNAMAGTGSSWRERRGCHFDWIKREANSPRPLHTESQKGKSGTSSEEMEPKMHRQAPSPEKQTIPVKRAKKLEHRIQRLERQLAIVVQEKTKLKSDSDEMSAANEALKNECHQAEERNKAFDDKIQNLTHTYQRTLGRVNGRSVALLDIVLT